MMRRTRAGVLWATAAICSTALAQVITITEYASACSAIYTSGTTSVTIVQPTVTVQPIPFDDAAVNSGTPFALQLPPTGSGTKRKRAVEYIGYQGYLTDDASIAADYTITNGQLSISDRDGTPLRYMSTYTGASSEPFQLPATAGNINTTFVAQSGVLYWKSPSFHGGSATFNLDYDNSRIYIGFDGTSQGDWIAVNLQPIPGE